MPEVDSVRLGRRLWPPVALTFAVGIILIIIHLANRGVFTSGPYAPEGHLQPSGKHAPLKRKEPLRILFAGTSGIARGSWVEQELQAALSACRTTGVVLERLAKPGANSRWGERMIRERLANLPAPDIVVIEFAGNDARLYRGMRPNESWERHQRMLEASRRAGALPYLATMGRAVGRELLERPGYRTYQQQYRAIAREIGAGVIDTAPRWASLNRNELQAYLPDGVHFTSNAASDLLVPGFVEALAPQVCDRGTGKQ